MDFEQYINQGKVIVGEKDPQKAKALVKMSEDNLSVVNTLEINEVFASPVVSLSYESLREILEAMCLIQGYKVYSHEAFTAYLKKVYEEKIAEQFDRFRKLRNGVNYYGKRVSKEVAADARKQINVLCKELKSKYLMHLFDVK